MAEVNVTGDGDGVWDLLANPYRRQALRYVGGRSRKVTMFELALALSKDSPAGDTVEDIEVRLHHVHLPMLADHGAVRYDPDEKVVAATEHTEFHLDIAESLEHEPECVS